MKGTVTCAVVAREGHKIDKSVRRNLKIKVITERGDAVHFSEEEDQESGLIFKFGSPLRGGCEVVATLSSLHLPGSPLFIPSQSVKEKVFHGLGLLPQDNKDYIRSTEFSKVGRSQESKEIFPHQEGKVKVEKDAGQEGVYGSKPGMPKVEYKHVGQEDLMASHEGKCSSAEGAKRNLRGKLELVCGAEKPKNTSESIEDDSKLPTTSTNPSVNIVARLFESKNEKGDKEMEEGVSCYVLDEDTKMWHAGQVYKIISDNLITVKNLDYGSHGCSRLYNGYSRDHIVLNIGDIPKDALCADSARVSVVWEESKAEDHIFQVGDHCVARWRDDMVWYRAEILETSPKIVVKFTDYGNIDQVEEGDIVSAGFEVPPADVLAGLVDGGVVLEEEERSAITNKEDASACSTGKNSIDPHVQTPSSEDSHNPRTNEKDGLKSGKSFVEENIPSESSGLEISELACCICGRLKKVLNIMSHPFLISFCRPCIVLPAIEHQFAGTVR